MTSPAPHPSTTLEATSGAVERASRRVADLLLQVTDPWAPAIGVWNVAETATHLSQSSAAFLASATGRAEPEDLSQNATTTVRAVAAEPERDLRVLAQRIRSGEGDLVAFARTAAGDPLVPAFHGIELPLSALLALELAELLVHGRDIARAARLPWPIKPAEADLALHGVVAMLPHQLDPRRASDLRLSCEVRVRHGSRALLVVRDGVGRVAASGSARPDCLLTVEPVTFLLLAYGRVTQYRAIAQGALVPWGRRPWLVARLMAAVRTA
jgi:uncharacterized protein (TIGR03083 family)